MRGERAALTAALVLLGTGWGLTQPLTKIAVRDGYGQFGLIAWQFAIGIVLLGALCAVTGRRLRRDPRALGIYAVIALAGTLIPNGAGYRAMYHLPSGVVSIVISAVPMLAFPMALVLGIDRFSTRRLAGLALGLGGVALIALPASSLPDPAMIAFLPLALVAPLCYAFEGNYVAKWGTAGLDPVQVLFGASLMGLPAALLLAVLTGQVIPPHLPLTDADLAMIANATIHTFVYTGYVWLVGRAGAVFAAQISYLVTGTGVLWAMLLLGERYSGWVWGALALMLAGMTLVQPRLTAPLAPAPLTGKSSGRQPTGG